MNLVLKLSQILLKIKTMMSHWEKYQMMIKKVAMNKVKMKRGKLIAPIELLGKVNFPLLK